MIHVFFDQFKVPTIKFGKCFAEFMIPIALLKKFEKYTLHKRYAVEHRHPKKEILQYIKIKVIAYIINFGGIKTIRNRKM